MLEPTDKQRTDLEDLQGPITLGQFHVVLNQSAFEHYRSASGRAVIEVGGKRNYDVHIDQILAGGELHYHAISVDLFCSAERLLRAY